MSALAAGWGAGYVTDIPYLPGYYRHQSPLHLHLACLIGGVAGIAIGPDTPLRYVELGCGAGFGAAMLAGCNPHWEVVGIDFNPAHIAAAREFAGRAGIENARFIEADLAAFAGTETARDLPQADVVTMHGVWSWVGDEVRDGVVRLLADKLRPGGIFYVSYNALPAWQGALGLQRLLLETGVRATGSSARQIAAGWEIAAALSEANAAHLRGSPFVQSLQEYARQAQPAYLAHEYMNATWRPCFHADVARALAGAKLDWVASAQLLENFTPLMLADAARAVAERYDDPIMRELIKDMCLTRCLRQDVFVRGARRLTQAERDAALGGVTLALQQDEAEFSWEFEVPVGQARFERPFFGPIVAALAEAPRRVDELLALPDLPRRDNPGELVGMLVGSHQALPVLGPAAVSSDRTFRFNRAAATYFVRPDMLDLGMALATSGTGSPLPCTMLDLFIASRLENGAPDSEAWARELGAGQSRAEQDRLCAFIERVLATRAPVWRRLGAVSRSMTSG
ncbi:MAG: methyltransferase regulatory domain-containing protein [Alphaproteobacteria bacterium]